MELSSVLTLIILCESTRTMAQPPANPWHRYPAQNDYSAENPELIGLLQNLLDVSEADCPDISMPCNPPLPIGPSSVSCEDIAGVDSDAKNYKSIGLPQGADSSEYYCQDGLYCSNEVNSPQVAAPRVSPMTANRANNARSSWKSSKYPVEEHPIQKELRGEELLLPQGNRSGLNVQRNHSNTEANESPHQKRPLTIGTLSTGAQPHPKKADNTRHDSRQKKGQHISLSGVRGGILDAQTPHQSFSAVKLKAKKRKSKTKISIKAKSKDNGGSNGGNNAFVDLHMQTTPTVFNNVQHIERNSMIGAREPAMTTPPTVTNKFVPTTTKIQSNIATKIPLQQNTTSTPPSRRKGANSLNSTTELPTSTTRNNKALSVNTRDRLPSTLSRDDLDNIISLPRNTPGEKHKPRMRVNSNGKPRTSDISSKPPGPDSLSTTVMNDSTTPKSTKKKMKPRVGNGSNGELRIPDVSPKPSGPESNSITVINEFTTPRNLLEMWFKNTGLDFDITNKTTKYDIEHNVLKMCGSIVTHSGNMNQMDIRGTNKLASDATTEEDLEATGAGCYETYVKPDRINRNTRAKRPKSAYHFEPIAFESPMYKPAPLNTKHNQQQPQHHQQKKNNFPNQIYPIPKRGQRQSKPIYQVEPEAESEEEDCDSENIEDTSVGNIEAGLNSYTIGRSANRLRAKSNTRADDILAHNESDREPTGVFDGIINNGSKKKSSINGLRRKLSDGFGAKSKQLKKPPSLYWNKIVKAQRGRKISVPTHSFRELRPFGNVYDHKGDLCVNELPSECTNRPYDDHLAQRRGYNSAEGGALLAVDHDNRDWADKSSISRESAESGDFLPQGQQNSNRYSRHFT